jgi:hypothetical protein
MSFALRWYDQYKKCYNRALTLSRGFFLVIGQEVESHG